MERRNTRYLALSGLKGQHSRAAYRVTLDTDVPLPSKQTCVLSGSSPGRRFPFPTTTPSLTETLRQVQAKTLAHGRGC